MNLHRHKNTYTYTHAYTHIYAHTNTCTHSLDKTYYQEMKQYAGNAASIDLHTYDYNIVPSSKGIVVNITHEGCSYVVAQWPSI